MSPDSSAARRQTIADLHFQRDSSCRPPFHALLIGRSHGQAQSRYSTLLAPANCRCRGRDTDYPLARPRTFQEIDLIADRTDPPISILLRRPFVLSLRPRRAKEIRRELHEVLVRPEHVEQIWPRRRGRNRHRRNSRLAPALDLQPIWNLTATADMARMPLRVAPPRRRRRRPRSRSRIDAPDNRNGVAVRRRAHQRDRRDRQRVGTQAKLGADQSTPGRS